MKSKKPYLIKDENIDPNYFTLIYGLKINDPTIVNLALKSKIDPRKLFLEEKIEDDDGYSLSYNLVTAIDFAKKNSLQEIYANLLRQINSSKDELIEREVFKTLYLIREKDLAINFLLKKEKFIKKVIPFLNKETINKEYDVSYAVLDVDTKIKKITFLDVACHYCSKNLIELLIKQGANKFNSMPVLSIINSLNCHNASYVAELIRLILETGYKIQEKEWHKIISKLYVKFVSEILKKQQPLDLVSIQMLKNKSRVLYEIWEKRTKGKGYSKYPLLSDIKKYEGLEIKILKEYFELNVVKDTGLFFKNKSLRQACLKKWGVSGSRFLNIIQDEVLNKSKNSVNINFKMIKVINFAHNIFIKNFNNNSAFLDFLESYSNFNDENFSQIVTHLTDKNIDKFCSFLNKMYSVNQIKDVLLNEEIEITDHHSDTVTMYSKFSKELDLILKNKKFHEINNLQKLHDLFVQEAELLKTKDFALVQEKKYPQLKNISKIKLPEKYKVVLAERNHDLVRWGSLMSHCIGRADYGESAKKGEIIVMALSQNDEPKYCVEICPKKKKISQVQGKSNTKPSTDILNAFNKEMKKIGIL